MEKMEGKSLDIQSRLKEILKENVPEIFLENKIDFDVLKHLLGEEVEFEKERYSFTWHGKAEARRNAQIPSTGTLRPVQNVQNATHTHG